MSLRGKIALVTGASRGIGKGIAVELGAAGATVYVTGRPAASALNFPQTSTLEEVAREIDARGGKGVVAHCDHADPAAVAELFRRVEREQHRLDILVNNAYAAVQFVGKNVGRKFWHIDDAPEDAWDTVNNVGLKNHYVCSVHAARLMAQQKSGLIVTVSSPGGIKYLFNIAYGVGKAGCDRLAADMAFDLHDVGVTSVALWPGAVKTEIIQQTVLAGRGKTDPAIFEKGESIYFAGKCVTALAADAEQLKHTGKIVLTTDLAEQYGIVDVDGGKPVDPIYKKSKVFADFVNDIRTHDIGRKAAL